MTGLRQQLSDGLTKLYTDFPNMPIVCQAIAEGQAILQDYNKATDRFNTNLEVPASTSADIKLSSVADNDAPINNHTGNVKRYPWQSGECLEDRKSVFQAHIVPIHDKTDVSFHLSIRSWL